jgi:hypothetical protein
MGNRRYLYGFSSENPDRAMKAISLEVLSANAYWDVFQNFKDVRVYLPMQTQVEFRGLKFLFFCFLISFRVQGVGNACYSSF